ncbi:unnamed protein product [Schistosoma margrebowiei]|uniref:Uncharacterized protein n=1 Tax=Schistosoma margrebowiei TaxID=48269 RepID=A0A183LJ21_9TREM|nr:unnamed protein product [Schistosoma margrebowiei]
MLLSLVLFFLLITISNGLTKFISSNFIEYVSGENDYLHLRVINPSTLPFTYRLSPGQIGPHFNTTFTSTSLVVTEPPHACELVSNYHFSVNRGCSFVTKAINAHVAGAVAVIVYDFNRKAIHTFSMIQDDTSRRVQIPCAFMNGKDGYDPDHHFLITSELFPECYENFGDEWCN